MDKEEPQHKPRGAAGASCSPSAPQLPLFLNHEAAVSSGTIHPSWQVSASWSLLHISSQCWHQICFVSTICPPPPSSPSPPGPWVHADLRKRQNQGEKKVAQAFQIFIFNWQSNAGTFSGLRLRKCFQSYLLWTKCYSALCPSSLVRSVLCNTHWAETEAQLNVGGTGSGEWWLFLQKLSITIYLIWDFEVKNKQKKKSHAPNMLKREAYRTIHPWLDHCERMEHLASVLICW